MRSWIGLYALLKMIRDAKMTTFTREGITTMLNEAKDVPMLDIFGGENWTPRTTTPASTSGPGPTTGPPTSGIPTPRRRTGSRATSSRPRRSSFDEVLCGSIFGAPAGDVLTGERSADARRGVSDQEGR